MVKRNLYLTENGYVVISKYFVLYSNAYCIVLYCMLHCISHSIIIVIILISSSFKLQSKYHVLHAMLRQAMHILYCNVLNIVLCIQYCTYFTVLYIILCILYCTTYCIGRWAGPGKGDPVDWCCAGSYVFSRSEISSCCRQ